jgi:RecA/RadA recombinase
MNQFKKATKQQSRLRLCISGPSGSGKTFTALKIATGIGGRIAVIDTERGSASKYADLFRFDVMELGDYHPNAYISAIREAESAGYDILIIDSTTHEWSGKSGILELQDAATRRMRNPNSYTAWADVTPLHNAFIDAILKCNAHVIATVRSKMDYVQDKDSSGKTQVRRVGMASVQRDGMDYEYDVVLEMNAEHVGIVAKTRCAALDERSWEKPGEELARMLSDWLSDGGAPPPQQPPEQAKPTQVSIAEATTFYNIAKSGGASDEVIKAWLIEHYSIDSTKKLTGDIFKEACVRAKEDLKAKLPPMSDADFASQFDTYQQAVYSRKKTVAELLIMIESKNTLTPAQRSVVERIGEAAA